MSAEWERCKPWIEAALPYAGGTHTIEDIEAAIAANQMALLACKKSALICEVRNYPRLRALHIFLAGGNLEEIKGLNALMDNAARTLGCSRISLAGRPGWQRALKEFGYEPKWTVLSKDIEI